MSTYNDFASFYDELMSNAPYDQWVQQIDSMIKANMAGAKTIIDLACGTGNISSRLYKKGYQVMGVDLSESMLMIAQDKAHESNQRIQYLCQDMTAFEIHKKVDVITCICDGFNYLKNVDEIRKVFVRAAKHLNHQGLMIVDFSSEYKLSEVLGNHTIAELGEVVSFIWENQYNSEDRHLEFDIAFFSKKTGAKDTYQRFMEHHNQYAYTSTEIAAAAEELFEVLMTVDGETFETVNECSERIMMVLKKC